MENTAEKRSSSSSDSKAITPKNTGLLSVIPAASPQFQLYSDTEVITAIWPILPVYLGVWYTTGLSIQEVDLLRRLQPNYYSELGYFTGGLSLLSLSRRGLSVQLWRLYSLSLIGYQFGAKNRHLIRQNLGHSAIRLFS